MLHPGLTSANNCSSAYDRIPGKFFSDFLALFKAIFIRIRWSSNCVTLPAVNSDLTVDCGPNTIILEVNLCTAQWAGFNGTSLALNGQHNSSQCLGLTDSTVDPPVVRFQLPVNDSQENPCRTSLQVNIVLFYQLNFHTETQYSFCIWCIFIYIYNVRKLNFIFVNQWLHTV